MIIIWGALPLLVIIMVVLGIMLAAGQAITGMLDQVAIAFFVVFTLLCIGWLYCGAIRNKCIISSLIASAIHYIVFLTYARPGYGLLKSLFIEAYMTEENGILNMIMGTVIVFPFLLVILAAILYIEFMWFGMAIAYDGKKEFSFYAVSGTALYAIVLAVGYLILHHIFG